MKPLNLVLKNQVIESKKEHFEKVKMFCASKNVCFEIAPEKNTNYYDLRKQLSCLHAGRQGGNEWVK